MHVLRECKIYQFLCDIDIQLLSSGAECIITFFTRIFLHLARSISAIIRSFPDGVNIIIHVVHFLMV